MILVSRVDILRLQTQRAALTAANPGIGVAEVMKQLGVKWQTLSDKEKVGDSSYGAG